MITPADSRSMLIASFSPIDWPVLHTLRKYPSLVPQRLANSGRRAGGRLLMNASKCSMSLNLPYSKPRSKAFYRPVFSLGSAAVENDPMDIDAIVATRRERLRQLINDRFDGRQTHFVEATGINAGELSGLLRTKHFGEKKARTLEAQLGLPNMWLDGEPEKPAVSDDSREILDLWPYLLPSQKEEVLKLARPLAEYNRDVQRQLSTRTVSVRPKTHTPIGHGNTQIGKGRKNAKD